MSTPSTHISIRDLSVSFESQPVLKNVSLDIPDRKITVIIGPSGCGKTTLLRALNRLLDSVDSARIEGTILVDGEDIYDPKTEVTHIRKKMGLLSQKPQVLPMSIFDNIAYGPRIHGLAWGPDLEDLVEASLQRAALWEEVKDKLRQSAFDLSGGQQQRLCIARVLAVEPEVLLMDEPASALDPISTLRIEELMQELKRNYTIVIVTHNMQQAARVSQETGFFLNGELIEFGPSRRMFTEPSDRRTEDYITGRFG